MAFKRSGFGPVLPMQDVRPIPPESSASWVRTGLSCPCGTLPETPRANIRNHQLVRPRGAVVESLSLWFLRSQVNVG